MIDSAEVLVQIVNVKWIGIEELRCLITVVLEIDQILSTGLEMGLVVTRNLEDQGDLKNLVAGVDRSLEAVRTTEVLEEMILHHLGGVVEDGNDYDGSFEFLGGPEVLLERIGA